jgi:phosphoribosylformimino-5-aminoimidazole carboxamide ribotide isomerase
MIIIPAIDIIDGKCVRLSKGDYNTKKEYSNKPLEVAQQFEAAGITHLHLVDLDGAKNGEVTNWEVLSEICKHTKLKVDFSGGIKKTEHIQKILELGADKVTIGSMAINRPDTVSRWLLDFGNEKIIIGADTHHGNIAIHGWQKESNTKIGDFIMGYYLQGVLNFMCTDIEKDGMLQGPSTALYASILEEFIDLKLIASGGVTSLQDLLALKEIGCHAAIVGKAIYEGHISLEEIGGF